MNIADRREFSSCFAGVGAASMRLGGPLPAQAQEKKSVRLRLFTKSHNSVAPPHYFNPVVPGMKVDRTRRPFTPANRFA